MHFFFQRINLLEQSIKDGDNPVFFFGFLKKCDFFLQKCWFFKIFNFYFFRVRLFENAALNWVVKSI